MEYGFVYVLGNECMPGIYKIGFTRGHPLERVGQLSSSTACPMPFQLLAYIGCQEPQAVEGRIHADLDRFRVNSSREFFRVPPWLIQDQLRQHGDDCTDAFFSSPLDWAVDFDDIQRNRQWPIDYFHEQCADPIIWKDEEVIPWEFD